MIREVTATGRDVNDAIEQGCAQLAIDRDDAQFEIISLPRKGFLGLKVYPAKVRVYQELPDPKPAPAPQRAPAPAPQRAPAPAPQRAPAPAPQRAPAPAPQRAPAPAPQRAPAPAPQRAPAPAPQRAPAPAPQRAPRPEREHTEFKPQVEAVPTDLVRGKVEKAAVYLADIMRAMGFEGIEVTPRYYEENVCLQLSGAQMGVVIGRRGETLDALQYLTSLVANRGEGEYIRINIDSGNYREKREKTLTALARKLALQAVRSGKSTTLEPMNPYERRVIHGAVSQIRGATSTSVGADPNRRVVIASADPSKVRPAPTGERTAPRPFTPRPPVAGARPAPVVPRPVVAEPSPVASAPRPVAADPSPVASAPRPVAAEPSPVASTPRPVAADPSPVASTPRPVVADPSPVASAPRPVVAPRPAPAGDRPERSGDRFAGRGGDRGGRSGGDRGGRGGRDRGDRPAPYVPDPNAERPKLSDAELFASVPTGVPVVSGTPRAPRPVQKTEKPAPRKLDDFGTPGTYGKIE